MNYFGISADLIELLFKYAKQILEPPFMQAGPKMKTGDIQIVDSECASFRSSFRMRLKPESKARYVALHAALWPELASLLSEFGVTDYSIFLDENGIDLFAVRRMHDSLVDQNLRHHPVMKRWWTEMLPLMECDADGVPLTWPLVEVFYLP